MSAVPIHFKQARLDIIVVHGGTEGIPAAEAWLHASLSGWSEENVKKSPYLDFRFQGFSCFHPEGFPSPVRALGIDVTAFMPAQVLSPTADVAAQNLLNQAVDGFKMAYPDGTLVAVTRFPVEAVGLDEVDLVMTNVANLALVPPSIPGAAPQVDPLISLEDLQESLGAHRWKGLWSSPEALSTVLGLSVTPQTQDRWNRLLAPARHQEMEDRWPRSPVSSRRPRI